MKKAKGAWWGSKEFFPGTEERTRLVMICADLARYASLDEAFAEVVDYIRRGETEFAARYDPWLFFSVMAYGTNDHLHRLEALHASYNRMWQQHPDLWERIDARALPTTLWLIAPDLSPRYGLIQPGLDGGFEILSAPDIRQTPRYDCYAQNESAVCRIAMIPIAAEEIEGAWAWWTDDPQGRTSRCCDMML